MSRSFGFNQTRFSDKDFPRLIAAARNAVEKFDRDTAWIGTPSDGMVETMLDGALPSLAFGMQSDNENGDPWVPLALTSVGSVQITFTATKPYVRIVAER